MLKNTQIENELNKIPDKTKNKYNIEEYQGIKKIYQGVVIHKPSVINIMFNKDFNVREDDFTITISNKKISIILWKESYNMHTTVYYS